MKSRTTTHALTVRIASEFFTRNTSSVEETIAKVIGSCLENQWTCLWSYSSSETADIPSVIKRLGQSASKVDIYKAKYSYKPQGKRKAVSEQVQYGLFHQEELSDLSVTSAIAKPSTSTSRPVDEYMIMIRP